MAIDLTQIRISSLNERDDLRTGRMQLGLDVLTSEEHPDGNWIGEFLAALPEPLEAFNPGYVLSAEVDSTGLARRCWNLDICKNADGVPVLRVGGNFYRVVQTGYNVTCGKLKGRLSFVLQKPLSGEYTQVTVKFISALNRETYVVPASLDRDWVDPTTDKVCDDIGNRLETDLTLDDESEPSVDMSIYLSLPKEPPMLMGVLGVGEFRLTSIQGPFPKKSQSGRQWNQYRIALDNGITVFSEGGTTDQLDAKPQIIEEVRNKPWTLLITKVEALEPKEPGGEPKYRVACALKPRAPMVVNRD